jgi:hypothetical protein
MAIAELKKIAVITNRIMDDFFFSDAADASFSDAADAADFCASIVCEGVGNELGIHLLVSSLLARLD